jgi:hypothetical protein
MISLLPFTPKPLAVGRRDDGSDASAARGHKGDLAVHSLVEHVSKLGPQVSCTYLGRKVSSHALIVPNVRPRLVLCCSVVYAHVQYGNVKEGMMGHTGTNAARALKLIARAFPTLTVAKLALDLQVSTRTVYRWRAGQYQPNADNREALKQLVRDLRREVNMAPYMLRNADRWLGRCRDGRARSRWVGGVDRGGPPPG